MVWPNSRRVHFIRCQEDEGTCGGHSLDLNVNDGLTDADRSNGIRRVLLPVVWLALKVNFRKAAVTGATQCDHWVLPAMHLERVAFWRIKA
jgi:hypothetical protein